MASYVALLRGVNVAGSRRLPMAELRDVLEGLGLSDVRTYLQSGNAVFTADHRVPEALAEKIQSALASATGHDIDVLVLTADKIGAVAARNPFVAESTSASVDQKHLHVTFLFEDPPADRLPSLDTAAAAGERAHVDGDVVYLLLPHGVGRTKLDVARLLRVRATSRNWNTVTALAQMAQP